MAPSLVARWNHPGWGIQSWRFHLRGQYDLWSGQPLLPDFECPICSSTQYSFSESPLRLHYFFFLQESADDHQNGLSSPNCQKHWNQVNNRSKGLSLIEFSFHLYCFHEPELAKVISSPLTSGSEVSPGSLLHFFGLPWLHNNLLPPHPFLHRISVLFVPLPSLELWEFVKASLSFTLKGLSTPAGHLTWL